MLSHFESLWGEIKTECEPDSVLEIGSNNGDLLKFARSKGASQVLGIDPAANLKPSDDSGIMSICGMFDGISASIAHTAMPKVDVIVARHVFAHIDDWNGFVRHLDAVAQKDTLIVIEVPYLGDLLRGAEFDSCYHEHLSYVSIGSIEALLKHSPFHIHEVRHFPVHGGAIVFMLRRNDCDKQPFPLPFECIHPNAWDDFALRAQRRIDDLRFRVRTMAAYGMTIAGFGASAKSTVWLQACGLTNLEVNFIVDSTPQKQGRCSPGTSIPIVPECELDDADVAINFAWNYTTDIKAKIQPWLERGGILLDPHHPDMADTPHPKFSKVPD